MASNRFDKRILAIFFGHQPWRRPGNCSMGSGVISVPLGAPSVWFTTFSRHDGTKSMSKNVSDLFGAFPKCLNGS